MRKPMENLIRIYFLFSWKTMDELATKKAPNTKFFQAKC